MTLQAIVNRAFLNLSLKSLEFEGFKFLQKVTPDDIYRVIEKDSPWVLSPEALKWAEPLYIRFHGALEQYTPEYVLERLRIKRPELYSIVITHPRGQEWIRARIEELRTQLNTLLPQS